MCLALALLPIATAAAAHDHAPGIGAAQAPGGPAETPASGDANGPAPICHQLGACHAFVAPSLPDLAHERPPLTVAPAGIARPPEAAPHRLFRPPRIATRA